MAKSNGLAGMSVEELRAEIERRQRRGGPLLARRAKVLAALSEVDAQLEALGLASEEPVIAAHALRRPKPGKRTPRKRRRPGSGGARDRGFGPVKLALMAALKGRPLPMAEAHAELRKAGHDILYNYLRVMLADRRCFRRVSRGVYEAT